MAAPARPGLVAGRVTMLEPQEVIDTQVPPRPPDRKIKLIKNELGTRSVNLGCAAEHERMLEHDETGFAGPQGGRSSPPQTAIPHYFSGGFSRLEEKVRASGTSLKIGLLCVLGFGIAILLFKESRTTSVADYPNNTYKYIEKANRLSEINKYFYSLNYSRDEVLLYKGDNCEIVPRQGILTKEGSFIVIERKKHSISEGKADIGVVASNEHRTFPGSLLLANQRLVDNSPDVLAVDRALLTYTVNLPGLTSDGSFQIIPSFREYQSNLNRVLKTWFQKYAIDHYIGANFQSSESLAYSKELVRVKFGLDFLSPLIESTIGFNAMDKREKLIKLYKLTQVFYTVSVEAIKRPIDLFGSRVTLRDIVDKTTEDCPPVLVDSVSYGRIIYVKIETTSTDEEAEAFLAKKLPLFNTHYNKNTIEGLHELKDLQFGVFVIGGHVNHTQFINVKSIEEINSIIVKYNRLSPENVGVPISYSCQFVKDNSRAVVNMFTDYYETTVHEYAKGIVKIFHKAVSKMEWEIKWSEISYENGEKLTKAKAWNMNWRTLTPPFVSEDIELPGNAEGISVLAKVYTLLPWDKWRTVINRTNIPLISRREFHVWGSSINPQSSIVPEI